jgi:hypothetical protein
MMKGWPLLFVPTIALLLVPRNRLASSHWSHGICHNSRNSNDIDAVIEFSCPTPLSRAHAASLIDTTFLPQQLFGERLSVSGSNVNDSQTPQIILGTDPSLQLAYGEFLLSSVDALVDAALSHRQEDNPNASNGNGSTSNNDAIASVNFVDLGSGAGRICLYMAMTRPSWSSCGMEVVPSLHALAQQAALMAEEYGILQSQVARQDNEDSPDDSTENADSIAKASSSLQLCRGAAQEYTHILEQADIIFCYSTVFDTAGFSQETGAMILSTEWMELLQNCRPGTLVITTDRSCDPAYGWTLLQTMEVENREVMGSVGYIQRKG